jgi:hypothetical protein
VGIVGLSEGNGHPFSFSAIVNGYDDDLFSQAGWPVIQKYLRIQPAEAFGFPNVRVTHAWTQFPETTEKLCKACKIDKAVGRPEEMLGEIDALIIGRDDWETHFSLAMPALERGIKVFIDKPLTLNAEELRLLEPYLKAGQMMSTAGLRYAVELDPIRYNPKLVGAVKLIHGAVLNSPERYGIHLIDALLGLGYGVPTRLTRLISPHDSFSMIFGEDGPQFILNCLGAVGKTFHLGIYGAAGNFQADLHDNFGAFRRTLAAFFTMVQTGIQPIAPEQTIGTMKLLMAMQEMGVGDTRALDWGSQI